MSWHCPSCASVEDVLPGILQLDTRYARGKCWRCGEVVLWESDDKPRARATDPDTSRIAVSMVGETHSAILRRAIVAKFAAHGPMIDDDLIGWFGVGKYVTPSGVRSRRDELVERGVVRYSGRKASTKTGRPSRVWELTPAGKDWYERNR